MRILAAVVLVLALGSAAPSTAGLKQDLVEELGAPETTMVLSDGDATQPEVTGWAALHTRNPWMLTVLVRVLQLLL